MSPLSPSRTRPGVWQKRCQMLGPAPSARGDPSIWYADVAAPQRKEVGNSVVMAAGAHEQSIAATPQAQRPGREFLAIVVGSLQTRGRRRSSPPGSGKLPVGAIAPARSAG